MMGNDTEIFKAERGLGILIYRVCIALSLVLVTGLGTWNLSETHAASIAIGRLAQHVQDRDEEMNRMSKTVDGIRDNESNLNARMSIIETRMSGRP